MADLFLLPEVTCLRAELLYRFRQITNLVTNAYHHEDSDHPHTIYDAILELARPSWIYEQFDDFERQLRKNLPLKSLTVNKGA